MKSTERHFFQNTEEVGPILAIIAPSPFRENVNCSEEFPVENVNFYLH
jgi:hypothetical protein